MTRRIPYIADGVLHQPDPTNDSPITVGSPGWWRWLDDPATRSFAFRCAVGHFTARKERRQRGSTYWTAYRTFRKRAASAYLGKSADLTLARLTTVAANMREPGSPKPPPSRSGAGSTPSAAQPRASSTLPVLTTKLFRPRPRATLVLRPRLVQQLDAGHRLTLTLLAAPAGFGKTTLLADWLSQGPGGWPRGSGTRNQAPGITEPGSSEHDQWSDPAESWFARGSDTEDQQPGNDLPDPAIAWLSLDAADNDPVLFLRALIAALQTVQPTVGTRALAQLQAIEPLALDALLVTLLNDLATLEGQVILVLDDYHVITTPAIHAALTVMLDHRPPALHMVMATREEPPLPLSRWRARGELLELRAADLRFTSDEAARFFREVMGLALSADAVTALADHTEGWIAGLQLAALAIRDRPDAASFITEFTGSTRFIIDYLAEEVISRLPAHLQAFLRQTAILERLCGALCDAVVLGGDDDTPTPYSQLLLDELERRQLFLIPLDVQRTWYRYHHLFRDVLCRQLVQGVAGDALALLHRRASAWLARHGLVGDAVQHALAAQHWEGAIELLEQHGLVLLAGGQIHTVLAWVNALPEPQFGAHPLLHLLHAMALLLTDQLPAAAARLAEAERGIDADMPDEQSRRLRGHMHVVRATIHRALGDLPGYLAQMRQAVVLLPESDLFFSTATVAVAHGFTLSGDVSAAVEREVAAAIEPARQAGNLISMLLSLTDLARLHALQGRLHVAAAAYERAAQIAPDARVLEHLFGREAYYFGLGDLLRERNELDAAEQLLTRGIELAKGALLVYPDLLVQGYIALARLKQARGDSLGALQLLGEFVLLARQRELAPALIARATAARARIALAQGDLAAATRWADASNLTLDDAVSFRDETEYLTLARVCIAQGRSIPAGSDLHATLHLLDRLQAAAETDGRRGSLNEIGIVRALALHAQGNIPRALIVLADVLTHAAPEGYVRLFVDEGVTMVDLLERMHAEGSSTDEYVRELLAASGIATGHHPFGKLGASSASRMAQPLVEPLTARELEVLRLLVAGHSTQEIAQELIVVLGTVKRHISNIFGKLDVHSRIEAVARAHDLHLL